MSKWKEYLAKKLHVISLALLFGLVWHILCVYDSGVSEDIREMTTFLVVLFTILYFDFDKKKAEK